MNRRIHTLAAFALLWCCLFSSPLVAQRHTTDSLRALLKNDTARAKQAAVYLELAQSFGWNDPDSIIFYARQAASLAETLHLDSIAFESYFSIAHAHYVTGLTSEGIQSGLKAYAIAEARKKEAWISKCANALGLLYQNANKYAESVSFFQQSITLQQKSGDKPRLATGLNNLANSYLKLNRIDSSLYYRRQAIHLRNAIGDQNLLSECYNDIGETFIITNQPDSARLYLNRALAIKLAFNDKEMLAVITLNLGVLDLKYDHAEEAIKNFKAAEGYSIAINSYSYLSEVYAKLAECSRKLNRMDDAYNYLKLHEQYKDSVLNIESQQQINELNASFQTEKKSIEIENLKKEKLKNDAINAEKDLRKNLILAFSLLFVLAIGIYSFLLLKRFRLIRAQKLTIEQQKAEVELKNKEITDSIHYAKRIQDSLLPQQRSMQKNIERLRQKD